MLSKQSNIKLNKIIKCYDYNRQIEELMDEAFTAILNYIFGSFGSVKEYLVGCELDWHKIGIISGELLLEIINGEKVSKAKIFNGFWRDYYNIFFRKLQWGFSVSIDVHNEIETLFDLLYNIRNNQFSIDDFKRNDDVDKFYIKYDIGTIYNIVSKSIKSKNDLKLFTVSFNEFFNQNVNAPLKIGVDISNKDLNDKHSLDRIKNMLDVRIDEAIKILKDLDIFGEKVEISLPRLIDEKAKDAFNGFKYEYMGCKNEVLGLFVFYNRKEQKLDFDCESVLKFDSKDNSRLYLTYTSNASLKQKDRIDNIYMLIQTNDGKGVCKEYLSFDEYGDDYNISTKTLSPSFLDAIYVKAERTKNSVSTATTF